MSDTLKINPRFESALPPLTEEEFCKLESSIVAERQVRDPIVVWNDFIVDGHHRYKIARKNKITAYQVVTMQFESEDAALAWILDTQSGRRNLTPQQIKIARGKLYNAMKADHGGDRTSDGAKGKNCPLLNTAEIVAEKTGSTPRTTKLHGAVVEAIESLPVSLKKQIEAEEIETTDKDILALAAAPQDAQIAVARALRTGQTKDLHKAMAGKVKATKPKQGKAVDDTATLFKDAHTELGHLSKAVYALGSKCGKHTQFKVADKTLSDLEKLLKQWQSEVRS